MKKKSLLTLRRKKKSRRKSSSRKKNKVKKSRSRNRATIIDGYIQHSRLTFTSDCNSALVLEFFGDIILRSFEVNFNNYYFTYSYNSTKIKLTSNYLEDSTYSNIIYNLSIFDKKSCLSIVSFMRKNLKRSMINKKNCGENKLIAFENVNNLYEDLKSY